MLSISATDHLRAVRREAVIGLLELSGVDNSRLSPELEARKRGTETRLRARYAGFLRQDFLSIPIMAAYQKYYKRFTKTYHVLLQLESIVLKGKSLPDVSPLVDANFTAEVDTLILTAGHDVAKLVSPIVMDVSKSGDSIVRMNGAPKEMEARDIIMRDATGVVCSILYGQDNISPITSATTHALYVAYAPAGVPAEAVGSHLKMIEENVRLFCPSAVVEQSHLLTA